MQADHAPQTSSSRPRRCRRLTALVKAVRELQSAAPITSQVIARPQDITVAEIRIESFFPMNEPTRAFFHGRDIFPK